MRNPLSKYLGEARLVDDECMPEEPKIHLVSQNGLADFYELLSEHKIGFTIRKGLPGFYTSGGEAVQILGAPAPIAASLAAVLFCWLKQRRARKIILQLKDHQIVHMEANAFSVDQVEKLIGKIRSISVIQTEKDDDQ